MAEYTVDEMAVKNTAIVSDDVHAIYMRAFDEIEASLKTQLEILKNQMNLDETKYAKRVVYTAVTEILAMPPDKLREKLVQLKHK